MRYAARQARQLEAGSGLTQSQAEGVARHVAAVAYSVLERVGDAYASKSNLERSELEQRAAWEGFKNEFRTTVGADLVALKVKRLSPFLLQSDFVLLCVLFCSSQLQLRFYERILFIKKNIASLGPAIASWLASLSRHTSLRFISNIVHPFPRKSATMSGCGARWTKSAKRYGGRWTS